jgi:hypothetical protein
MPKRIIAFGIAEGGYREAVPVLKAYLQTTTVGKHAHGNDLLTIELSCSLLQR